MSTHSSPFPFCFQPTPTSNADDHRHTSTAAPPPPPPPPPNDKNTNLTTCLYNTHLGLFSLTWSRTLFGRSLHLNLHPHENLCDFSPSSSPLSSSSSSPLSFHLHVKNFIFSKKSGSKKINKFHIFWDLSRAKFGSRPEPQSGFYLAVLVDSEMFLLVGDSVKEAYAKTKAKKHEHKSQVLILRREHVFGNRVYMTQARIGGRNREILIDCNVNHHHHGDAKLCISVDNKRVLQIKKLKWKFRGNEKIDVDGTGLQVSWDVYNWLFEDGLDGHAVFMFRFEKDESFEEINNDWSRNNEVSLVKDMVLWSGSTTCSFGMNEIELRKMRKSMLRSARSSSSSSISSSASSGGSSSVMEWASMEENELTGPVGFSLLVYAWKR